MGDYFIESIEIRDAAFRFRRVPGAMPVHSESDYGFAVTLLESGTKPTLDTACQVLT